MQGNGVTFKNIAENVILNHFFLVLQFSIFSADFIRL